MNLIPSKRMTGINGAERRRQWRSFSGARRLVLSPPPLRPLHFAPSCRRVLLKLTRWPVYLRRGSASSGKKGPSGAVDRCAAAMESSRFLQTNATFGVFPTGPAHADTENPAEANTKIRFRPSERENRLESNPSRFHPNRICRKNKRQNKNGGDSSVVRLDFMWGFSVCVASPAPPPAHTHTTHPCNEEKHDEISSSPQLPLHTVTKPAAAPTSAA